MTSKSKVESYRKAVSARNIIMNILCYAIFNALVLGNYLLSKTTSPIYLVYIFVSLTWCVTIILKLVPVKKIKEVADILTVNRRTLEIDIFSKKLKDLELKRKIQHYKLRKLKRNTLMNKS